MRRLSAAETCRSRAATSSSRASRASSCFWRHSFSRRSRAFPQEPLGLGRLLASFALGQLCQLHCRNRRRHGVLDRREGVELEALARPFPSSPLEAAPGAAGSVRGAALPCRNAPTPCWSSPTWSMHEHKKELLPPRQSRSSGAWLPQALRHADLSAGIKLLSPVRQSRTSLLFREFLSRAFRY